MIGHLYRYPHPNDPSRFIYVGQGRSRHSSHKNGYSSFGRRFKTRFPDAVLSSPIKELVEVQDQRELNELETIWMFQFHTWRGYDGGMNLQLPGPEDYRNLAIMAKERGRILGATAVTSGHLERIRGTKKFKKAQRENGFVMGEKNKHYLTPFNSSKEHQSAAGKLGGK